MMPVLDLTDEELQGLILVCATGSGPGVSWVLTNALLTKARLAQEASADKTDKSGQTGLSNLSTRPGNSEDHDAAVPRA